MEKFNGWTNRETWVVALWLNNTESTYFYWTNRAKELVTAIGYGSDNDRMLGSKYLLSEELQKSIEENTPTSSGMYADLLGKAISAVDFYSIAEHYIEDALEELENEKTDYEQDKKRCGW